jgi:hypothetical protein
MEQGWACSSAGLCGPTELGAKGRGRVGYLADSPAVAAAHGPTSHPQHVAQHAQRVGRGGQGVFVKEPARMAYGGLDAVFDDTCGNLLNLHQD